MPDRENQRERGDDASGTLRRATLAALVAAVLACGFAAHRVALAAPADQAATAVSLNLRGVPASKAYAELARQSGVEIAFVPDPYSDDPEGEPRLTARLIQEPFWAAVDQLNRQSGLVVRDVARQPAPRLTLYRSQRPGTFGGLQTFATGAFYSTLLGRPTFSGRPPAKQPHPGRRELVVRLDAEPRLRPLFWHSMQVDELIDANGRHIPHVVLLNPNAPRMVPFYGGPASIALRVDGPADVSLRVSRFTLSGKVMAGRRSEVAEVTGLDGTSPRAGYAGGFRVEAKNLTTPRGRFIRVSLTRVGDDGPSWLRPASRMYVLDPVVLDDKARRVNAPPVEFRTSGRTCHILLKLGLSGARTGAVVVHPGEPHRLLLDVPTDVIDYDVRLQFSDVLVK